jgi:signal transduction histidine kinase
MLIDHVLEAARVDTRRKEYALAEMDLVPQLQAAIATVQSRNGLDDGAIVLEASELRVRTNPVGLEIVLVNLLDNAVKYSLDAVKIRVTAFKASEGQVAVAITDTGVGIPRNQLKRVFHRFHRIGNETTRIRKGTGLGLYIVKETLKSLKGTIRATSPGERLGSTFTITLPGA